MKMKVLFHDCCFDGAASAAVFCRFFREKVRPDAEFEFRGMSHGPGGHPIDPALLSGDENVIVDFRYSQSPQLTWWFDHHQSAFQVPGDEAHFRADGSGKKFHDPKAKSCTKFLADLATARFGFDQGPMADLIAWADLIDGAQFPTAAMAVRLEEPALKLMMVLEANKDAALIPRVIEAMQHRTLDSIVAEPWIQAPLAPLLQRHQAAIALVKREAREEGGVVLADLTSEPVEALNKFIAYDLFPSAQYTVTVTRSGARAKVSLGFNPWSRSERKHDLSRIAERFGGGGHPVVSAMSFKPEEIERARSVGREIAAELRG